MSWVLLILAVLAALVLVAGKLLVIAAALATLALVTSAVARRFKRSAAARRVRRAVERGWVVEVGKTGQLTVVQLERGDEEPYVIGSLPISLPHWEYAERLEELRLEAQEKADVLNRRLPA